MLSILNTVKAFEFEKLQKSEKKNIDGPYSHQFLNMPVEICKTIGEKAPSIGLTNRYFRGPYSHQFFIQIQSIGSTERLRWGPYSHQFLLNFQTIRKIGSHTCRSERKK